MAAEGIKLDTGVFDTLLSAYSRQAEDTLGFYASEAAINGLRYPRHEEATAVATFVRSIRSAAEAYQKDPLWSPLIPNWNRVESALPTFLDEFREAVRLDNDLVDVPPPSVHRLGAVLPSKTADRTQKTALVVPPVWQDKGHLPPSI
jgi:hypothetical protein